MPEQFWNVQPYRYMSELDANYTKGVLGLGRKAAEETAVEIEAWMKANAPWRDRPDGPKSERARKDIKTPHARASLTAFVVYDPEDVAFAKDELAKAQNADDLLIDELNERQREKRSQAYTRVKLLRTKGQRRAQRQRIRTQKQYQYYNRRNLPKNKSNVVATEKWLKGQVAGFVDIHIQYDREVTYARWLELAHGQRFSIIGRTMRHFEPKFMAKMRSMLNLVQYRDQYSFPPVLSPEEKFAKHIEYENNYRKEYGMPSYQPWSESERVKKAKNRAEYDPVEAKAYRENRRAYQQMLGKQPARRLEKAPVRTMSINITRSR